MFLVSVSERMRGLLSVAHMPWILFIATYMVSASRAQDPKWTPIVLHMMTRFLLSFCYWGILTMGPALANDLLRTTWAPLESIRSHTPLYEVRQDTLTDTPSAPRPMDMRSRSWDTVHVDTRMMRSLHKQTGHFFSLSPGENVSTDTYALRFSTELNCVSLQISSMCFWITALVLMHYDC